MKNTPSAHRRTLTGATGLVASLLLVLLAGCSSKPPACDSPQASAVAQTIFADEFSRIATASYSDNSDTFEPSDVSRIKTEIDSYAKGLKVGISQAVQNGYDSDARKFSCAGQLTVTAPRGSTFARSTEYSVQATADGMDTFIVKVVAADPFVQSLRQDFAKLLTAKNIDLRYRGAIAKLAELAAESAPANACVDQKMVAAKAELSQRMGQLEKEAEAKGEPFRGLSPVQEEEWQAKSLQNAQQECK